MALIDIGSTKQLFVDNYLIESLTNTKQVMNPAQKVEHNPVIRPERPWEGNDVRPSHVMFDEKDQVFKMWYSARTFRANQGKDEIMVEGEDDSVVCLATSEDGLHWERPVLGMVKFQGSTETNILPARSFMPYFFQDLHEEDPAKRYKGLIRLGSTTTPGMQKATHDFVLAQFELYHSPDGFNWTPDENNPVIDTSPRVGRWGPTDFMGWDPIRQTYAVHMENCLHRRCPLGKRLIGRAESPDMIHFSDPETILIPDEQDSPDTEFYAMPAITYEGIYVGMLWIFRTTNTTHHPQIVFSRDGIHYNRNYREPFIVRGAKGDFDATSIYVITPVVHGNCIFTYYTGTNWRSPETLLTLGDKAIAGVGLAITLLDGFVSLDGARTNWSEMVTRSFGFSGTQLHLNLSSALQQWGAGPCEVRVEILSPNHEPLSGFTFEDADPITISGQDHVVSWQGKSELNELSNKTIKLRFYFKNAKLYSFQFR